MKTILEYINNNNIRHTVHHISKMKLYAQLFFILLSIHACKEHKKEGFKLEPSTCETLKKDIQQEFKVKNFTKTITLYKDYETCLNDKQEFHTKLALLYKENNQLEACKRHLKIVIQLIEKNNIISTNEKAISKAYIHLIIDDTENAKKETLIITRDTLTKTQLEELEFIEMFTNQGEFIELDFKTEFNLFK